MRLLSVQSIKLSFIDSGTGEQMMDNKKKRIYIRFSLIQALFFSIFAVSTYQTVYMQEIGINSTQIGTIIAIASFVGLVASPVWGIISDWLQSARRPFVVSVTVTAALFIFMPFVGTLTGGCVSVFYIYIPLIFIFKQASNSLLDSWCISELSGLGIGYGSVRMWGSIGYSVISILLGIMVTVLSRTGNMFWFMLPPALLLGWLCQKRNGERKPAKNPKDRYEKKGRIRELLNNTTFLIYLVYAFGLNIYLAVTLIFMPYILEYAGYPTEQMGIVTGFRALVEILSMFAGSQLARKFPLKYIIILPGILFGLEHILYQFAYGLPSILSIMILSGLAGGFYYSLGPSYIYEIIHSNVKSTAQTINAMGLTLVSIVGSAVGGFVIDTWGISTMTTGCGILILTLTVVFILSLKINSRKE